MVGEGDLRPRWHTAVLATAMFAVDPYGTGGLVVRAGAPIRDKLVELVRGFLDKQAPVKRLPLTITDDRLLGGLDIGV